MIEQFVALNITAADSRAADIAASVDKDLVAPLAEHKRLRPLLLHLLNDLSERRKAWQAADIVRVERQYFSKFFERETGFKFSCWDRELRVRIATLLFHQKGRNIASVALAVGYPDPNTFLRAFKKCLGIGPRAYRQSREPA